MDEQRVDLTTRHVRAAIAHDSESRDWIVRRFSPLLEAQARMRLGRTQVSSQDAEDVVAEAWLVTLPRLEDIAPRAGRYTPVLLSFLATTVRALCNRRIENALRRRPGGLPVEGLADAARPARHARDDWTGRIREALDALGEPTRTVVLMRAVEGLDNGTVAAELGEPATNVSHRYRRAIARLRESLPDSVFGELDDE